MTTLITTPGIYPDIAADDYHGKEICDGPSISASGLKVVLDCPVKYWLGSPLNPDRPNEKRTKAKTLGDAAHNLLLLGEGWADRYFVVPDGFSAAHHKKWAHLLAEYEAAVARGATILTAKQHETVLAMYAALQKNETAVSAFANGKPEQTMAWKDKETGVWLRCRPDFLPNKLKLIPDYKTAENASPKAFRKAVWDYRYHVQAALYLDGIEAVTGERPRSFFFVAQEKEPPYVVEIYPLSERALWAGQIMMRKAVRRFAECLSADKWPSYNEEVVTLDLPAWADREVTENYWKEDAPIAA